MSADASSSDVLRLTLAEIRALDAEMEARADVAAYRLKPGTLSPSAVAVAGLDGALFISNGVNRWENQFIGEVPATPAWLAAWRQLLARRQAEAAARRILLWNLVIPEKQVAAPEQRWAGPAPDGARRPLSALLPLLDPEIRLFYAADAMARAKAQAPIHFRRNSHWTPSACCAVLFELFAKMDVAADADTQRFAYRRMREVHDLAKHFFTPAPEEERGALAPSGAYLFEQRTAPITGRNTGTSFHLRNPDAPDPRRVMVFGDSFSADEGLALALSAVFVEVRFFWAKDVSWSLVDGLGADVVLWESAERFLVTAPQA